MVGPINSTVASLLFGQSSGSATTGLDADLLTSWAKAKVGQAIDLKELSKDPNAPVVEPWTPGIALSSDSYVQRALTGKAFFDTNTQLYADVGATGDYRRLYALHSGVSALQALAAAAGADKITRTDKARLTQEFERGLKELEGFFSTQKFEDVRLAQGDRVDAAQTTLALPMTSEDYLTGIIHRGSLSDAVLGLDKDAKFTMVVTGASGVAKAIAIDLSQMGSIPRSLGAVISFINTQLSANGVATRLAAEDKTPAKSTFVIAGRTIESRYTGPKQYALRVDVRGGEAVSFEPTAARPAFYAVGAVAGGARLIKLEDVGDQAGQPVKLDRPGATADPVGPGVATGWLGPGSPYQSAPTGAYEVRTNPLFSDASNNFETAIRAPGEAVLKLAFDDGRVLTVSTAWRSDDIEGWRQRTGESSDRAIADDLAERLTQLLHEQGVAAGVDVVADGSNLSFSIKTGDFVKASSLAISGRSATLTPVDPPNMVGGLREGVAARRFEATAVAASGALFQGAQDFTITTAKGTESITIDGGDTGVDGATIAARLNIELRSRGIDAAASMVDGGGFTSLRIDALHSVTGVSASINGGQQTATLLAPGSWAQGGLPVAASGQPLGDAIRSYTVTGSPPLASYTGDVTLEVVVATPAGNKTVTVTVTALERASDPDPAPGEWSTAFQDRLDAALNAAGVYVDARGADLMNWSVAEGSGQRLQSITINAAPLAFAGATPAFGVGGAFAAERSLTSASIAAGADDVLAALSADPSASITFDTIWGQKTISAALQSGDPRTLNSVALRLNEALTAAGYDIGVEATTISGAGAGLRFVTGDSHSVRNVTALDVGGDGYGVTLDAIDSASRADDPVGAASVAQRVARGAVAVEALPSAATLIAPSVNAGGWFPGRAFDVAVGDNAKVATARAVATGADGAVYVLADLSGDSATSVIKGARDVALMKYDSAGKLIFTEVLGATQSASGFALAVSADGKVAVAGAVEGALSGADAAKGGADSFVSLFDGSGQELWTARRAATGNDEARSVAFAADGTVIVAGKTESSLGAALSLGGADAYVRGFSSAGSELFAQQFGTGGDDAATALLVEAGSGGAINIFTAGVESSRGVVRKFTYSSAGLASVGSRDIGYFATGSLNALASSGGALYVGGEVGADRLALGTAARGAVAGKEGFVARLDAGLVSTALDRATYVGSAQDDAVRSIAIVNGDVYAAGVSGAVLDGVGGGKTSFLTRLDAEGDLAWTRTFNSSSGGFTLNALAADAGGVSALDALGLPRGRVAAADPRGVVTRSALRAGDEFRIGADGRLLTRIRIAADDSLSALAAAINRAIGSAGKAEIVREDGVERLKITARTGQAVRIEAGRSGVDALPALGLDSGIIASATVARGGVKTFGLALSAQDLKLGTAAEIARTKAELSAAGSIVRQAYESLLYRNAKEPTAAEKALEERRQNVGAAPAYLTAQLANYQAALTRLRGY